MYKRPTVHSDNVAIDDKIGSAYEDVKIVADNIDAILLTAAGAEISLKYLGAFEVPPLTRLNGSPLEDGDYYFDTTDGMEALVYYDLVDTTWFNVDSQAAVDAAASANASRIAAEAAEATATTKAGEASTSATNAANSEALAAQAVLDAVAAKDAAAISATAAALSETAASNSETNAGTSATNANTSAVNANASELAAATSASNASSSETNAGVSESNAATSASNASTSETNALASANAASTSEGNAATSESNASTSATDSEASNVKSQAWAESELSPVYAGAPVGSKSSKEHAEEAAASAVAAITAETNAGVSASNASDSEATVTASANAAAISESNAATSETNAATSETNAGNSASAASTSETNASNSASAASTSETNASTSATNAATSETNAQTSETNAASSAAAAAISETNAGTSETNADAAASISAANANFKGEWSGLTGALNVPSSVKHLNIVYMLLNNLADVTASEPTGVNPDWFVLGTIGGSSPNADLLGGELPAYYLDMDNFVEGTTNKILTVAERAKLAGIAEGAQYDILKNHGIESGCVFSINVGDANTYDVSAGVYWIDGVKYNFAGVVGRPSLGLAGSFSSVGLNASGLVDMLNNFIDLASAETTLEIVTFAKFTDTTINTVGSSRDETAEFIKDIYLRMKYFEATLFKNGAGTITKSSTALQLDIEAGTVSAPNGKRVDIAQVSDLGASPIYAVSGVATIFPTVTPFVVDHTVYNNMTDLVALPTDKYVVHTFAKSMRTGANYFVYGTVTYDNLGAAEAAEPDLSVFANIQEGSFLEPLALIIIREGIADIIEVIDVREGRAANTIDSIAGKTIPTMVSGDVLKFNGTQLVAEAPTNTVGQGVTLFLGDTIISGDNYNLTTAPLGGPEIEVQQTANSGDSPQFIERYVTDPLGGNVIDAGAWGFKTYASVDSNAGNTSIVARVNRAVDKAGSITVTGTGQTRTFTASEAGTFAFGDADPSILNATLIQTPTETFWIESYVSDTIVTATTDGVGYINETEVGFSMYYKLFESLVADNITGTAPALYEVNVVEPAFNVDPTDRMLIAYFLNVDTAANKTVSLYKNGSENYSHFSTPLLTRHNNLAGLNDGDFQHLTAAEKVSLINHTTNVSNPHGVDKADVGLSNVDNTSDANKPISTAQQAALDTKVDDGQVLTDVPLGAEFTDTTYSVGDGGLTEKNFSTADKAKLDSVASGANNYSHPANHAPSIITQDASNRFVTDAEKVTWNAKLDAADITGKVDDTTTVNGQPLSSNVTVTATDVGLGNVDNTSDANKPVSTAQQTALDAKVNGIGGVTNIEAVVALPGSPVVGTLYIITG